MARARPKTFHRRKRQPARLPVLLRFNRSIETTLQLVGHQHLDKIRDGDGDRLVWQTLAYRINVGVALAANHYGEHDDLRDALADAVRALCEVGKRYTRVGKFGCSGDEYRAIGRGLDLTDELQKATTRKQQLIASSLVIVDDDACGRTLPEYAGGTA